MATLSFLRDAAQLDAALAKVKAGSDPQVAWVLTEVIADGDVKLVDTGATLDDLVDEFADAKEMFAMARVVDPNSGLAKLVLFCWCGEGVPGLRKSRFPQHLDAASAYFAGYNLRIIARDEGDVDPQLIFKKLADASGSKYSVHDQAAPPKAPTSRPVRTPSVGQGTPRAITTSHIVATPPVKPIVAPKPAFNAFAKPASPAATFKPTPTPTTAARPAAAAGAAAPTFKPAFAPSAAAFQSSSTTSTASASASSSAPDASASAGEKSARQLELEAMIKARQEREEQEYKEEMAMRSARRSRENVSVENSTPTPTAAPAVPVIPAGMTKSINLGGILSAPAPGSYSPPTQRAAAVPAAHVQPASPVTATTVSASNSGGGVAAMSAKFSSLAVSSGGSPGTSPGTSPRAVRKWPTVGASSSPPPAPVNATVESPVVPQPAQTPEPAAPRLPLVAGSSVSAPVAPLMAGSSVSAPVPAPAPVVQPTPAPAPVPTPAAAPALPPRGNPVFDVDATPVPAAEPEPEPEPATGPVPVDTSLPNLYVAAHAFSPSDPTEVLLHVGDVVAVIESVDGWAVVERVDGTHVRGMCPLTYLDRVLDVVLAMDAPDAVRVAEFDFAGNPAEGELPLRAGQLVVHVAMVDDEWLEGKAYGAAEAQAAGYFPATYVRPVADM